MTPRDEPGASGMSHASGTSDGTTPIAWRAVEEGTPVAGPGGRIGALSSVVADDDKDIFHGIAVDADGRTVLVEQGHVRQMTGDRIDVDLSADDLRALPTYDERAREPL